MKMTRFFLLTGAIAMTTIGLACVSQSTPAYHAMDLYVQGVNAYHKGDDTTAVAKLSQATQSDPNLLMPHSVLGDLYRQQGQYSLALSQYQTLAKLDPYGSTNQYRLGLTYQWLNRFEDAVAAYLKALDLNPRDAKSSSNLGLVYMTLGKMDDAVAYTRKATELDPKSPAVWSNYGVVLDASGKASEAEQAYRKSLELNRAQDAILVNLGANLTRQKKTAEAINVLNQAVRRLDNAVTHKLYGDALASGDRYADALSEYDIALKRDPHFYPAMNEKAAVLIAQYRKGLELDESKKRDAMALWKQSLALNPQQPHIQAALHDWSQPRLFAK